MQKGKATKSYGIAVARLAGLPQQVIERAKDVLAKLEKYELAVFTEEKATGLGATAAKQNASQFSLFDLNNELAVNEIRNADIEAMSPDETKALLNDIRRKII